MLEASDRIVGRALKHLYWLVRRLVVQIVFALVVFAGGIALGAVWHARRSRVSMPPPPLPVVQRSDEKPWPLTKQIVARSLQSHSFRTDKLRLNSNDEVVWRWLKDSIAKYPQNWVKLDLADRHSYGVVLYPSKVLEPGELTRCNEELSSKGMPPMQPRKRYIPVQVNIDDVMCPDWHGFIDADEAQLVYFEGISG